MPISLSRSFLLALLTLFTPVPSTSVPVPSDSDPESDPDSDSDSDSDSDVEENVEQSTYFRNYRFLAQIKLGKITEEYWAVECARCVLKLLGINTVRWTTSVPNSAQQYTIPRSTGTTDDAMVVFNNHPSAEAFSLFWDNECLKCVFDRDTQRGTYRYKCVPLKVLVRMNNTDDDLKVIIEKLRDGNIMEFFQKTRPEGMAAEQVDSVQKYAASLIEAAKALVENLLD